MKLFRRPPSRLKTLRGTRRTRVRAIEFSLKDQPIITLDEIFELNRRKYWKFDLAGPRF